MSNRPDEKVVSALFTQAHRAAHEATRVLGAIVIDYPHELEELNEDYAKTIRDAFPLALQLRDMLAKWERK